MDQVKHGGSLWSKSALAKELNKDRRTIDKRLKDIKPCGMSRGNPVWSLAVACKAIFAGEAPELVGEQDPDKMHPADRKAWMESELKRIELFEKKGQYIECEDYREDLAFSFKTLIQGIENLPDILERECNLNMQQFGRMQQAIDDLRDDLFEQMSQ